MKVKTEFFGAEMGTLDLKTVLVGRRIGKIS